MNRRKFVNKTFAAGIASFVSLKSLETYSLINRDLSQNESWIDVNDIIPAPDDPTKWNAWREEITTWRMKKQLQLKYDGSSYRSIPFQWASSDFSCCFIMICDADFYDFKNNQYTISHLVADGKKQYGGYDSVVLWHAYPRIGLDERNQFDFYREMPFGLPGVAGVVEQFHKSGIKVFINYNPWDTGTRRESKPDIDVLIDILKSIDGDGIFLDTMKDAPGFRQKLDSVKPGIVLEGEIALPLEHIESHHMSWAQWFKDSYVPGVYRNKWFEHRHMLHAIERWNSDKISVLHTAWMNGSGILIWENVFGQWLGWNERDKALYRTMYSVQHHFAELFYGNEWIPLSQQSSPEGVFVSSWGGENIQLWTLVNRREKPVTGELMKTEHKKGMKYFDLIKGEEIVGAIQNGQISFKGNMGSRGIACFLEIEGTRINPEFTDFLKRQKTLMKSSSEDVTIPVRQNAFSHDIETAKHSSLPTGMVLVPSVSLKMNMEYTFRESGAFGNIQEHLQLAVTHNLHTICRITRDTALKKFAIDETPVTNAQFMEFLDQTGYKPKVKENFLKHWLKGKIPSGMEDHPVVYVDADDARAFARWKGKRLPTDEEWQFAAQGNDGLNYPWGNEMAVNKCNQNTNGMTSPVKAFPEGISPFGCYDMCGNTWELTGREYSDGKTRFVILKGGSCYKANGSVWYADGGPQKNSFFEKMLLIWPGLDRCSTIGFRCAVDL